jgi:XTP/dITP diphosphohydrolase
VSQLHSLLLGTRNEGKLRELQELLGDLPLTIRGLGDYPGVTDIAETGSTFAENASLKAAGYAMQTDLMTLADDSGLEVDALGGHPGVFSARYSGEHASDTERIKKLLVALSHVPAPQRTARFVSVIVIAGNQGQILDVSTGKCEGRIDAAPRGSKGFGYDPIFVPNGYDQTFAELRSDVKNQISHRAQALMRARAFLRTLTKA